MDFKSYLRGLGMGMVITTIILMATFAQNNKKPTNAEIASMARELGMVETSAFLSSQNRTEGEGETKPAMTEGATDSNTGLPTEGGISEPTEGDTGEPTEAPTESGTGEPTEAGASEPAGQNGGTSVTGEQIIVEMNNFKQAYVAAELLESAGVIDDSEEFTKYMVENGYSRRLFNGTYTFTKGMTYEQVANILGRVE